MIPTLPLIEVIVLGAATAAIGALAALHRKIFFAEAITHASFPGAVLGVVLSSALAPGLSTQARSLWLFTGSFVMCLALSLAMRWIAQIPGISPPAAAGVVLTFAFSSGYFLAKWFQPLPIRVDTFLTGSVLTVNKIDVLCACSLLLLVVAVFGRWWWPLVFRAFDPGMLAHKSRLIDATVLILICAAVTVAIPAVGAIVPISLLAAPAGVAWALARTPGRFLFVSVTTGVVMGSGGLLLGVVADLSTGGCIALLGGLSYVLALLLRNARV
ncbi:metal ABC transporter permease [Corynebacterium sp. H130]|uniref:metal ABC transporter permease n=1 Tax=Corynebacterium sp. H130 TaxID=3133444 RepID=UPI00309DDAC6